MSKILQLGIEWRWKWECHARDVIDAWREDITFARVYASGVLPNPSLIIKELCRTNSITPQPGVTSGFLLLLKVAWNADQLDFQKSSLTSLEPSWNLLE